MILDGADSGGDSENGGAAGTPESPSEPEGARSEIDKLRDRVGRATINVNKEDGPTS